MIVNLIYFKDSGKYYGEGRYNTLLVNMHDIWDEVREMSKTQTLPGLIVGHSKFIVSKKN